MDIPTVSPWNGMKIIVRDTVPDGSFVITDADGDVLSGGHVDSLTGWVRQHGKPAFIYANEACAFRLIMGGRENGARYAH